MKNCISDLKCLNNAIFDHLPTMLVSDKNIRIQEQLEEFCTTPYVISSTMVPSFCNIKISMAKLWPLLNQCKFFMDCVFCTKFRF